MDCPAGPFDNSGVEVGSNVHQSAGAGKSGQARYFLFTEGLIVRCGPFTNSAYGACPGFPAFPGHGQDGRGTKYVQRTKTLANGITVRAGGAGAACVSTGLNGDQFHVDIICRGLSFVVTIYRVREFPRL